MSENSITGDAMSAQAKEPSQWAKDAALDCWYTALNFKAVEAGPAMILRVQSAIDAATAEKDELHIMQLAAISTASGQNTESTARERIRRGHPYCTAAYEDVCRAVDREMKLIAATAEKDQEIERLKSDLASLNHALVPAPAASGRR